MAALAAQVLSSSTTRHREKMCSLQSQYHHTRRSQLGQVSLPSLRSRTSLEPRLLAQHHFPLHSPTSPRTGRLHGYGTSVMGIRQPTRTQPIFICWLEHIASNSQSRTRKDQRVSPRQTTSQPQGLRLSRHRLPELLTVVERLAGQQQCAGVENWRKKNSSAYCQSSLISFHGSTEGVLP